MCVCACHLGISNNFLLLQPVELIAGFHFPFEHDVNVQKRFLYRNDNYCGRLCGLSHGALNKNNKFLANESKQNRVTFLDYPKCA